MAQVYGDSRNYPKIDIYVDGKYELTTTWAKTCAIAVERFLNAYPQFNYGVAKVTASFQEGN